MIFQSICRPNFVFCSVIQFWDYKSTGKVRRGTIRDMAGRGCSRPLAIMAVLFSAGLIATDAAHIIGNSVPFKFPNGNFGKTVSHITETEEATECSPEVFSNWPGNCLEWKDQFLLRIHSETDARSQVNCSIISWESVTCVVDTFEDCFDLTDAHWYGGTVVNEMFWPIELQTERSRPYVTGDSIGTPAGYGGVQERYWVNSKGLGLYIDWEVPLWVSINSTGDQQLCFRSQYRDSPYHNFDDSQVWLRYTVCQGSDIRHVHDYMTSSYLSKPSDIPDERMFRYPIWSTWAQYKDDITQDLVLDFATSIVGNGFSNSQMEIDDKWELAYGDLDFDPVKFPDPRAMVETLTSMGFRTTLWIHPFVSLESSVMRDGMQRRHYVTDPVGRLPSFTSWWKDPTAMTVDFTRSGSRDSFMERLAALKINYNISSFKFDAGETNWLPDCFVLAAEDVHNPNIYTTIYAQMAFDADTSIRHQEVRVGAQTQRLPIFVRMLDKDSRWGYDNGLETLIPHALNVGIIGYPFVLPDMIGGNAYGALPDRELFIRWVELNVFLPSVQFSIVPWQFDEEVVEISRNMSRLHEFYAQTMIDLARESTITGAPIVRPLWWIAPTDPVALTIDSEFLVGDNILVAPIVKEHALSRDIYLPAGNWRDELRGDALTGGQWLINYRVELNELSYFTRVV